MNDSATEADDDMRVRREYRAASATIASARADAATWAAASGAEHDVVDQLMLIVSELATNAVEAGGESYTLWLDASPDRWTVSVINDAAVEALPPRSDWGPSEVLAERGRGLSIVDALSSRVIVDEADGRLRVTAQLDR